MRYTWLADVLRKAGLTVHEVSGWRTRGNDSYGPVRGITIHHTAGSRTSTDEGEIRVLLNGSESAPPPIAQLYLSRSGEWWVVAAGLCYHNKVGWDGPNEGYGNDALLGIEAQHSGDGEPWTPRQYDSYVRGVAALVRHRASGWSPTVGRVAGHKEHQPGSKTDPSFSMVAFRRDVQREIEEWDEMTPEQVRAEVVKAIRAELPTVVKEIWEHLVDIDVTQEGTNWQQVGSVIRYMSSEHHRLEDKIDALAAKVQQVLDDGAPSA